MSGQAEPARDGPAGEAERRILRRLTEQGIAFDLHEHPAVFTVEESAAIHGAMPGIHTKNLFLKDAADTVWLVTAPHDLPLDMKKLAVVIGAKRLSFASPALMQELLGLAPGSVTPLAVINDAGGRVRVVLDRRMAGDEVVNVHPLRNTATLALPGRSLVAVLTELGHAPMLVDLTEAQRAV